jgi:hypothetical protein
MRKKWLACSLLAVLGVCLAGLIFYNLPPIHDRLAWRVENFRAKIKYAINPPQEVVFVPQEQQSELDAIVQATMQALLPSPTPSLPPTSTPTPTLPGPTSTPQPSPTPTLTPTAVPEKVVLKGIKHEYQQMNNCGPATLAMGLSFWGWKGDQTDTRAFLRPNFRQYDDKNVMPAEMVNFVETQTNLKALVRVGGDLDMLKRLVAGGFPVIIEKGFQPPKEDWMGHFELVNGYDDNRERFITQDSYIMADFPLPYKEIESAWWRDFNYVYLVIYPPEREAEVLSILGPQADETYNYQYAAQRALDETSVLSGRDLFFAWYDRGTNLVALGDYSEAAKAYDKAFALYAALPLADRPWRMLWYQVGPYPAYYYTGRYQDVIELGNTTLSTLTEPVLEETYYWVGMARAAQGDMEKAIFDLKKAVDLNPNSTPASQELRRMGIEYP